MKRRILIVLGCLACAFFSTCAFVNLHEAMNRSRQKRTMAGLRSWGAAIEASMTRSGHLKTTPLIEGTSVDLAAIAAKHKLPLRDGWSHPMRISASKDSYLIQSAGSDGIFETITKRRTSSRPTTATSLTPMDRSFDSRKAYEGE